MTLEYLAGIVDGEGCIGVSCGRNFSLRLSIDMYNRRFIRQIADEFHGKYYENKSGMTSVVWQGEEAIQILQLLSPHLVIKKKVAEAGIAFREYQLSVWKNGAKYPTEVRNELCRRRDEVHAIVHAEYN